MKTRWHGAAVLAFGAVLLGVGALGASAKTDQVTAAAHQSSLVGTARDGAASLARFVGISDDDDEGSVAPGTLDDGKDLLPQAGITIDAAIASAQTAASGAIGEVDLEYYQDRLVFNVDVGEMDVKVDAETSEVLGAVSDD